MLTNLNIDNVNPAAAYELAKQMVKIRDIPFFFHGRPGIGKSELLEQLAKELNMKLEILMLTQIDSQDLRGIQYPDINTKRMVYYPPEFLPGPDSPPTLLFLDELTGAEPRMQVSAYQLLLSRRIGSYHLPDNCYVCAAGNGPQDGAIAYTMGTALSSRLLHISIVAEPRSWIKWAMANNINSSIITLIQLKGELLEQTQQQLEHDLLIGPNPRSWARVSKILEYVDIGNRAIAGPLVEGLIGRSAAADLFLTAEEMAGLPNPEDILKMNKDEFKKVLPKSISGMYGITYSLVAFANTAAEMRKALLFLDVAAEECTDLPAGDCKALGAELIMDKAMKSGCEEELMNSPEYQSVSAGISEIYNISSNKKADTGKKGNKKSKLVTV